MKLMGLGPFIFALENFRKGISKYSSHLACGPRHPNLSSSIFLHFSACSGGFKWKKLKGDRENKKQTKGRRGFKKSSNLFLAQKWAIFVYGHY